MSTNTIQPVQTNHPDSDEISIKDIILKTVGWTKYLLTKWKIILLAGILGGLIGYWTTYRQKPTYKAQLTFVLEEDKGGGSSGFGGFASQFGFDLGTSGGGAFAGANLIELMKSRRMVERTLLKPIIVNNVNITIAEYYMQINKVRENSTRQEAKNIKYVPGVDRSTFTQSQDSLLQIIFLNLTAPSALSIQQKDKKVSITTLEVTSGDELFSKIFCENLANETSEFYVETKSKKARLNVALLQRQTDSMRAEVNGAITDVAAATDDVFNLNSALNIKRAKGTRRQVDIQANTAILMSLVSNLEAAKMALLKETPLIQIIDKPILPLEKSGRGRLAAIKFYGVLAGFLAVLFIVLIRLYKKMFP